MPFTPGDPNINRNGRPPGSRNVITKKIEEQFANVLDNKLEDVERWIQQAAQDNPAKAVELLLKLSERFLPALTRQELTGKDGQDLFANTKFKFGDDINIDTNNDNEDTDISEYL